jgi:putative ABC transport system permease protein
VNVVMLRLAPYADETVVAREIRRWKHLEAYTRADMDEILIAKLIGARNRTIAGMILQQALGLGIIGFVVGRTAAALWAPIFPKYVLLLPGDAVMGAALVMAICALASIVAIRAALRIDPATAIGG